MKRDNTQMKGKQEGNRVIAEFMNLKAMEWDFDGTPMKIWIDKTTERTVYDEPELWYHSSWDWLMPVVEKIGDILADRDDAGYIETYSELAWGWEVKIWLEDILEPLVRLHSKESFIDAYWLAAIQFIHLVQSNNYTQ